MITTPNYYMPNYAYGTPYYSNYGNTMPQQSYAQAPQNMNAQSIIWVDGEVAAKAYQIPQGWPIGTPVVLWDQTEPVIYWKSIGMNGVPNPLVKFHYTMEEPQQKLPVGQMSGDADAKQYVTKNELDQMKQEIMNSIQQNQNGSQNGQNRGVNK